MSKAEFLSELEACKVIFWRTQGSKPLIAVSLSVPDRGDINLCIHSALMRKGGGGGGALCQTLTSMTLPPPCLQSETD